jgi:hypothetical protein
MNKPVILLMIVFIVFSCKSEQFQSKSDLALANLKGNVWKIDRTIHTTGHTCGCVLKTDCNQSKYVYNDKGNLLSWYTIDEYGIINDSTKYTYDKRGACSEISMFSLNKPAGKQIPEIQGGKITGHKIYNENGVLQTIMSYVYSGDDLIEEKTLNEKGELVSSVQKEILNGQIVSQTEKDDKGTVIKTSKFKRNANNDIEECLTVVAKDNKEFKLTYEFEYDGAGNWTKQTQFYDGAIINIILRNIEYYKYQ